MKWAARLHLAAIWQGWGVGYGLGVGGLSGAGLTGVDGFSFAHFHCVRDVRRCLGRVTGMPPRGVRAAQRPGRWWNAVEE